MNFILLLLTYFVEIKLKEAVSEIWADVFKLKFNLCNKLCN